MEKEIIRYHCKNGWITQPHLKDADLVISFVAAIGYWCY